MPRYSTEHWVEFLIGIWLILAPWILSFSGDLLEKWSSVLCGLVLVLVNGWIMAETYAHGNGEQK
jgi:putative Mn2+ efflux pump MntP